MASIIDDLIDFSLPVQSFNNLSAEELFQFLQESNRNRNQSAKRIKSIYELIINWAKNDHATRFWSLSQLLRNIPLHKLRREFLISTILSQNIISESHPCSKFLISAISKIIVQPERCSKRLKSCHSCQLFCFGGLNENNKDLGTVSHMNLFTGQWGTSPSMSADRILFTGAVIGQKVYLCGGNSYDRILDNMEVFDTRDGVWRTLRPMPEPRWESAAAAHDGYIYVTGGMDRSYNWLSSVSRYSVRANRWEPVTEMQVSRIGHQLVELDGRLYAIGGRANNTAEKYDPYSGQWSMIADTEHQHCLFGATAHRGEIYVCSDHGFEVYSPQTNSWKALSSLNEYLGRSLVSIEAENRLFAVGGGYINKGGTTSVFSYDVTTGIWSEINGMDAARQYHCSFIIG